MFDGVYLKGGKVYIVEVKPLNPDGSIKLSGPAGKMETQMSPQWIDSAIDRLEKSIDPAAQRTATLLRQSQQTSNLVKIVAGANENGMTIIKLK